MMTLPFESSFLRVSLPFSARCLLKSESWQQSKFLIDPSFSNERKDV